MLAFNPLKTESLLGIGLRQPHYAYVLEHTPPVGWFEVHAENFMMKGGPALQFLDRICEIYPLSLHGVGLSLGSAEGLDQSHLQKLKECIDRFSPFLVSEHLSWSRIQGVYLPDLLPLPYTDEAMAVLTQNIDHAQSFLGQEILLENPSSYFEYEGSTYSETEFLITLCQRTGAKILLDINNVYVSASNHGWSAIDYLNEIPSSLVREIHLAGHSVKTFEDGTSLLVDDHGACVCDDVWALYEQAVENGIYAPTLIEWDTDVPPFETLLKEANKAQLLLQKREVAYG